MHVEMSCDAFGGVGGQAIVNVLFDIFDLLFSLFVFASIVCLFFFCHFFLIVSFQLCVLWFGIETAQH